MKGALLLVALAALAGCSDSPTGEKGGEEVGDTVAASVVIVHAVRGRQDTAAWYITPDMKNDGGPGQFYIQVEGEALYPDGPRTQCGLTGRMDVPAAWRDTLDFVFECERAPQYLTVFTRDADSTGFRVTDEWVY